MTDSEKVDDIIERIKFHREAAWSDMHDEIDSGFKNKVDESTLEVIIFMCRTSFQRGFNRGATAVVIAFQERDRKEHVVE